MGPPLTVKGTHGKHTGIFQPSLDREHSACRRQGGRLEGAQQMGTTWHWQVVCQNPKLPIGEWAYACLPVVLIDGKMAAPETEIGSGYDTDGSVGWDSPR